MQSAFLYEKICEIQYYVSFSFLAHKLFRLVIKILVYTCLSFLWWKFSVQNIILF